MSLKGSVFASAAFEKRIALSRVTHGWTDEECAALERGDSEAREALKDAMLEQLIADPDDAEIDFMELWIGEKRETLAP